MIGLYDPTFDRDACGIGLIAHPDGVSRRSIVENGLEILANLAHRGAIGSDGRTSDGAGILLQIPKAFFRALPELSECLKQKDFAVGMIFFSSNVAERIQQELGFENLAAAHGFEVLGWRTVPVDQKVLGDQARALEPGIKQVFLATKVEQVDRERALYRLRKATETLPFYVCSLSFDSIVYKGLLLPGELSSYFLDLKNQRFTSSYALVHSRFSTNTLPAWPLAHPYRYVCHNGEINTVRGNLNWMRARESQLPDQAPFIPQGLSDSASLDRAVELLIQNGRTLPETLMTLVPQAWETDSSLSERVRDFYRYHAPRMEPWDGPAAICFADQYYIGATLDRSGLRPCRYIILQDGTLVLASEVGALRITNEKVKIRGRLGPGQMIVIDRNAKRLFKDNEIKTQVAIAKPYASWIQREEVESESLKTSPPHKMSRRELKRLTDAFGYTDEEIRMVLEPMLNDGEEATSSMGNDTPLAILSDKPQLLFKYFRQLFAQVTNPPIDSIREKLVMSLTTYIGRRPSPFHFNQSSSRRLKLERPILNAKIYSQIAASSEFRSKRINISFSRFDSEKGFSVHLRRVIDDAVSAVRGGCDVVILSDRLASADAVALPILLVASAVHHALIVAGIRTQASLVAETAEARDVHQFACLIGYGTDAIYPYLALEIADALHTDGRLHKISDSNEAIENFLKATDKGLLTIISKMGISCLQSYCGAQIFEIIGLADEVVAAFFTGTPSKIGGLKLNDIAAETFKRFDQADPNPIIHNLGLPNAGEIHYRAGGEVHFWSPKTIASLQEATRTKSSASFREFSDESNRLNQGTIRGALEIGKGGNAIPLNEVESAAEIVKHFTTGAMSFGSLSKEAHETLALAMNQISAKSNSGEGGESADRFATDSSGISKNSAIKQVASGRFGVTAHYLVNAKELQIKIAQGAKPGEGGKLPGHKVNETIAKMRYSIPGVTLISPPPHHDIYSIEDLAQLIFDLRKSNPEAAVSVKLVAAAGVGNIAAGVAKAGANKILISGDGGGTGASPLSSIKHAGSPWELGLAEVHQTLVMQGLRSQVRVETDGQLKTGRDVAIAALLGAEEFGFSTAPLIVEGCIMMRKCHLNTCPVGVATQDPELRKKFVGQPEHVINYFFFVAEELRQIMSELGISRLKDLVGRSDLLGFKPATEGKAKTIDLSRLLHQPKSLIPNVPTVLRYESDLAHSASNLSPLESALLAASENALQGKGIARVTLAIKNSDRTVGTRLSSEVAKRFGARGLKRDSIEAEFNGTAGQSFGAFLASGITLRLRGEANDFVGKGLSGGRIIIAPPWTSDDEASSVIAGNACLYGATSGEVFIEGVVGERFAVRNSGANAIIEGAGDHACEYMTGGNVIVLGKTGRNFAAGMSGGVAYVLDEDSELSERLSETSLELTALSESGDEDFVRAMITRHARETGSVKARWILGAWNEFVRKFKVVTPTEYKNALLKMQKVKSVSTKSESKEGVLIYG